VIGQKLSRPTVEIQTGGRIAARSSTPGGGP